MRPPSQDTDQRYRSLLQKAVRRGYTDDVIAISAFLEDRGTKERSWYRLRTVVIAFEECWPLAELLYFDRKFVSKLKALITITQSVKIKDAAGLGTLAYALSEGDNSVLSGDSDDKHIKVVANGIQRPDDFWKWVISQEVTETQHSIIENANKFKNVGWPWDKAFVQAGAYLAYLGINSKPQKAQPPDKPLQLWVALDRHTPHGKKALRKVSADLEVPVGQLEWTSFYCESAKTNEFESSKWWQKEVDWRLQKENLSYQDAKELWDKARPIFINQLKSETEDLKDHFNNWKAKNSAKIQELKTEIYSWENPLSKVKPKQNHLFDDRF